MNYYTTAFEWQKLCMTRSGRVLDVFTTAGIARHFPVIVHVLPPAEAWLTRSAMPTAFEEDIYLQSAMKPYSD